MGYVPFLGSIWNFFRLLFYLLPFLYESTKADLCDKEDVDKAMFLRGKIYTVAWGIIKFVLFIVLVFYIVIPTYTENVVLHQELNKRNNIINSYRDKEEIYKQNLNKLELSNNELITTLKLKTEEQGKLQNAFRRCMDTNNKVLDHLNTPADSNRITNEPDKSPMSKDIQDALGSIE